MGGLPRDARAVHEPVTGRRVIRADDVRAGLSKFRSGTIHGTVLHTAPSASGRERVEERVWNLAREIVAAAEEGECLRLGGRHRALADAESLRRTCMAVREAVARHLAGEDGR